MTYSGLIKYFEDYYGKYPNDTLRGAVGSYLSEFPEGRTEELAKLVMKNHFFRLGTPCVATIEKIHKAYCEDHDSLKKKLTRSATAPAEDNYKPMSDKEWEEAGEALLDLKKAVGRKA